MKKVVLAIAILLVIITAGILETVYVDKIFGELDDRLADVKQAIQAEDNAALRMLDDLQAWWDKRRGFMELFVYSPDVRNFSVALGEADGSLQCGDYDNALSKIESLLVMSDNIHRILDFNLADII